MPEILRIIVTADGGDICGTVKTVPCEYDCKIRLRAVK